MCPLLSKESFLTISSPKLGLGFSFSYYKSLGFGFQPFSLIYARSLFLYYLAFKYVYKFRVPAAGSGGTVVMAVMPYKRFRDRTQKSHISFFLAFYKF